MAEVYRHGKDGERCRERSPRCHWPSHARGRGPNDLIGRREAALQGLLLLFFFSVVTGTADASYESKQIPITFPVFIAIAALARNAIPPKEQEPMNLLYEAEAISMLAVSACVLERRKLKLPLAPGPHGEAPVIAKPCGHESVKRG